MKIIISSSMKFRDLIKSTMAKLETLGHVPLFPNIDYNAGDKILTPKEKNEFAWDHYKAIEEADAVYFILPNGYMGTSCKIELGYALAQKKPIYFSDPTNDTDLDAYSKKFIPVDELNLF